MDNPPHPPRPKRAARKNEAGASAPLGSTLRRPCARTVVHGDMRRRDGTGARGRPAGVDESGSSKEIGPIRSAVVGLLGDSVSEVPSLLPSTLAEDEVDEEENEAFPALPPASGHRNTPGEMLGPLQPPSGVAAAAGRVGLDYSSLADRLAVEAAAAAKAAAGSSGATVVRDDFSRLSVLPNFGGGRGGEAKPSPSDLRVLEGSSPGSMCSDGDVSQSPKLPSPPSQQTIAANSATRRASAETAALRARLRDRWFRLEAARKAQRQREVAERALMAAEDCATLGGAASVLGWNAGEGNHSSAEEGMGSDADENRDGGGVQDRRDLSAHTAMISASSETPLLGTRGTGTSAVREASVSSIPSRTVSASGMAAIKRSEAALVAVSTATPPMGTNTSSPLNQNEYSRHISATADAELADAAGSPSRPPENTNSELSDRDGGSESCCGGSPAVTGEHVNAACQAGMAGLLNDLLVRSGGRAADGKDKV